MDERADSKPGIASLFREDKTNLVLETSIHKWATYAAHF